MKTLRHATGLWLLLVTVACMVPARAQERHETPAESGTRLKLSVPGVERIELVRMTGGDTYLYHLHYDDGRQERLSPEDFAAAMYRIQSERPFWQRLLNISSVFGVAWVGLGLLGQVLFTGRMLIQWIVSEKAKRSVVPVAFWWMSLGGATMLMVYFIWRKDIVGVLGQATGWLIYSRNLYLIYRSSSPAFLR